MWDEVTVSDRRKEMINRFLESAVNILKLILACRSNIPVKNLHGEPLLDFLTLSDGLNNLTQSQDTTTIINPSEDKE